MSYPDGLLPDRWAYAAWPLLTFLGLWSIRLAPWSRLLQQGRLHAWLGAIVVLTLMWSMNVDSKPGLTLHLLGATTLTLMFGRALAILGLAIVLAAVTLNGTLAGAPGSMGWQTYALELLATAAFPVLVSHALWRASERWLPANLFIYLFVAVFLGAALTMIATGLLTTSLLWLAGIYTWAELMEDYFPYYLLLAFAEAWLNGAAMTLMVIYTPHWVVSFDDGRYLGRR